MSTRVIFMPPAKETYLHLKKYAHSKIERALLRAIDRKIEIIKDNHRYGNPIAKILIPKEYEQKYEANNLFRVELPNFWRMLYTVKNNEIEIIAFILDIVNHKDYNKKFGYKKN